MLGIEPTLCPVAFLGSTAAMCLAAGMRGTGTGIDAVQHLLLVVSLLADVRHGS